MPDEFSRRGFLALMGAVTVERIFPQHGGPQHPGLASAAPSFLLAGNAAAHGADDLFAKAGSLSATLTWSDPAPSAAGMRVRIALHSDPSHPIVQVTLPGDAVYYRLAVAPSTAYSWSVVPVAEGGEEHGDRAAHGSFTTIAPEIDPAANDGGPTNFWRVLNFYNEANGVRFAGVRPGTHGFMTRDEPPVGVAPPPVSPWFEHKPYDGVAPPSFETAKAALPVPILDEPQMVETYWYCWKTLIDVWLYPPTDPTTPFVVANNLGCKDWAGWGSVPLWDTAFMIEFGRYGHHAYPFITAYDNYYARQHENGFMAREADNNGHEVFVGNPLDAPLFAWAEWESYQLTGNQERLAQVLTPVVKFYEWWLRFQRRPNGLFWNQGEGMDDSPRNALLYESVSASTFMALFALSVARMAKVVGRPDLADYFEAQHAALGKVVNEHFWDDKHQLYNDRDGYGRLITELEPGVFCKHSFTFLPLLAEIVPPDRVQPLIRMLWDPKQFFVASGVASITVDSQAYNPPTGAYWRGSVWPPTQCIVQKGLKLAGEWDRAQQLAQKYLNAMVTAYQKQHTITEFLHPQELVGDGHPEFVGWGGIGPVQGLIEYVLGFDVSAPTQTVTWRITRADRHGIENLYMGQTKVDLLCAARSGPTDPCHLTVTSEKRITLVVHSNGAVMTRHIDPGTTQFVVG